MNVDSPSVLVTVNSARRYVLAVVGGAALLLAACSVAGETGRHPARSARRAPGDRPLLSVTVQSGDQHRTVRLRAGATVIEALDATQIRPVDGRLLSVTSHKVLGDDHHPATLSLDGRIVGPATPIDHPALLVVVGGPDAIEPVRSASVTIPPPGRPKALRSVHTSGRSGSARVVEGAFSGEVVRSTPATTPGPSVPAGGKRVSLTFDDGPWEGNTQQILAILAAKHVPAVFCLIGRQVREHPELVGRELVGGHQICNHTLDHDEHLGEAPPARVESQIEGGIDAITEHGFPAPAFYRPPAGSLSPAVYASAQRHREQVLYWSVDPSDWRRPPPDVLVDRVLFAVQPGAVVLLHDGGGDRSSTIAALPILIDRLRLAGYTFSLPILPASTGQ